MGFFEDVDADGIIEQHIKEVLRLEHDEGSAILENYTSIRQDLVDRLQRAPRGTFTHQHLAGVLAQVDGAIIALNDSLKSKMDQGTYKAALTGINHLLSEIDRFDQKFTGAVTPVNLRAAVLARDTANLMIMKYETSMNTYGQSVRQIIAQNLTMAAVGGESYGDVVQGIGQFFSAEEWRLQRLVRTELHHTYNIGKLKGFNELADGDIPDLLKTLMHPMDARTGEDSIYAAQLSLVAELDQPFVYEWKGKRREFMTPPDRPNDRAILVPYREAWGEAQGDAWIPGRYPSAS